MQLQREKPGEALTPAVCVHAEVGTGGCMSRLPPSREFRESPGSAAAVLAWLGSQKVGKYKSVPERGSPQAGRRAAAASRARPGRERGVRGAPTASELYRLRGSPVEGGEGALLKARMKSHSPVSGALGDRYKPGSQM